MVDRAVTVVDPEVDAEVAGPNLLQYVLNVPRQGRGETVPSSSRAGVLASDPPWVEALGHHRFHVGSPSSSVTRTSVPTPRPSPCNRRSTRKSNARSAGSTSFWSW